MFKRSTQTVCLFLLIAAPLLAQGGPPDEETLRIDQQIKEFTSTARGEEYARALAHLVWSDTPNPPTAPEVSARARELLLGWGKRGMPAIREALEWADPRYGADIMLAMREAERVMRSGTSPQMPAAIELGIWYGSPDARRLAMQNLNARPRNGMMLPVIDVAYDDPTMLPLVLESLKGMRSDKARFFLAETMENADTETRYRIAETMAVIGGRCLEYLRSWSLSEEQELRSIAVNALLPVANIGDLTTLYEYIGLYPDDDPQLLAALTARAQVLEAAFEAQQEIDSATPALDD